MRQPMWHLGTIARIRAAVGEATPSGVHVAWIDFPELAPLLTANAGPDARTKGLIYPVGFEGDWHVDKGRHLLVFYPLHHDTPLEIQGDDGIELVPTRAGSWHVIDGNVPHRIGLVRARPRYAVVAEWPKVAGLPAA